MPAKECFMLSSSLRWVAVLIPLMAAGTVFADSLPGGSHPDISRLPKEAAQLYADTTLFPQPTKWLDIPWGLDLNDSIRAAKAENRPVLIWVSGDDPLERC
jgi:hypothetical protein